MKNQLIYFLLIFFLVRCGSEKSEEDNPPIETLKKFKDSIDSFETLTFSDSTQIDIKSDPISIQSTVEMISLLLEEQPTLSNIARNFSLGGVFDADAFVRMQDMIGVRMWYCYNTSNKLYPEFFLAVEHIDQLTYDENDPEKLSPNPSFVIPETFQYNIDNYEEVTIKNFILDHKITTTIPARKLTQTEVTEFSNNFKSLMRIISPNSNRPYCKFAVAIFKYDPAYIKFMEEDPKPKWIRYYMGLARDPSHKPNYMRPILTGVGEDAKPILRVTRGDDSFLQKSVPPPPHQ